MNKAAVSVTDYALEVVHRDKFTESEWDDLEACVRTIRNYLGAGIAAARAIREIRDKKLFRGYRNMQEFCEKVFHITRQRAHQMIVFADVTDSLPPECQHVLTNESQARELAKVPLERRVEVLKEAVRIHGEQGKSIKKTAFSYGNLVDETGEPIPDGDATNYWRRIPEGTEMLARIHAVQRALEELNKHDLMWLECDLSGVINEIHAAWKRFKGGLPAYVCTSCGGMRSLNCVFCHGRGVVGRWKWRHCGDDDHAMARAVREARKKKQRVIDEPF